MVLFVARDLFFKNTKFWPRYDNSAELFETSPIAATRDTKNAQQGTEHRKHVPEMDPKERKVPPNK